MDGNGRWAKARGLSRLEGHRQGATVVRQITTYCREIGIRYLTLYSFSVQNWRRPPEEISGLMLLLEEYCQKERDTLLKNQIRLHTIGDQSRMPESTKAALQALQAETQSHDKMTLSLALGYGGREELVQAVQALMQTYHGDPQNIDVTSIEKFLYTRELPDPDLVIRTSGELRLSNFMLWQMAYSELHFTPTLWPDFSREDFAKALLDYSQRERRFGATSEQMQP